MIRRSSPAGKAINLFFSPVLEHGGIETLIVRFSRWLVAQGETVIIVTERKGSLVNGLDPRVILLEGGTETAIATTLRRQQGPASDGREIRSFSFNSKTLIRQLVFHCRYARDARLLSGVFHDCAYIPGKRLPGPATGINWAFDRILPDRAKWFMNGAVKRAHELRFSREFHDALVAPLPVTVPEGPARERQPKAFQVLSVGRLVPWKGYNLAMPQKIAELRAAGFPVEWVVAGDGPARGGMIERVRALGVENHVRFLGTVPYDQLSSLFLTAWAFVGVGTSLVEAAAAGVPAICSVASSGDSCYGLADEVPEPFCVGERVPGAPLRDLGAELKRALELDEEDYRRISGRMIQYSQCFSVDAVGRALLNWMDSSSEGTNLVDCSLGRKRALSLLKMYQDSFRPTVLRSIGIQENIRR